MNTGRPLIEKGADCDINTLPLHLRKLENSQVGDPTAVDMQKSGPYLDLTSPGVPDSWQLTCIWRVVAPEAIGVLATNDTV